MRYDTIVSAAGVALALACITGSVVTTCVKFRLASGLVETVGAISEGAKK